MLSVGLRDHSDGSAASRLPGRLHQHAGDLRLHQRRGDHHRVVPNKHAPRDTRTRRVFRRRHGEAVQEVHGDEKMGHDPRRLLDHHPRGT